MMTRRFDGLAGPRAVTTLCLVVLAFVCGWVVGGNGNKAEELDGEVATMASAQEVESIRLLIEAEQQAPSADAVVELVGPPPPPPGLRVGSEIVGAATLTKIDNGGAAAAEPDC